MTGKGAIAKSQSHPDNRLNPGSEAGRVTAVRLNAVKWEQAKPWVRWLPSRLDAPT
jgi:hypothetical protein